VQELLEENKMSNTLEVIEKNEALMLAKKPKVRLERSTA
jgi:hypothetical protein